MRHRHLRAPRGGIRRARFRDAAKLLSRRDANHAAFPEESRCTVSTSLEFKRPTFELVRIVESAGRGAVCAQLRVLDRASIRDAHAAASQARRAAPMEGRGVGSSAGVSALRVIRIPHFAEPGPEKRHFGSSSATPAAQSQPNRARHAP